MQLKCITAPCNCCTSAALCDVPTPPADPMQVASLTDIKEVTAAAVDGLEATLARLEAAGEAGMLGGVLPLSSHEAQGAGGAAARRGRLGRGPGSLRASADLAPASAAAAGTVDGLAREIVRAKLAEAEAVSAGRAEGCGAFELRMRRF